MSARPSKSNPFEHRLKQAKKYYPIVHPVVQWNKSDISMLHFLEHDSYYYTVPSSRTYDDMRNYIIMYKVDLDDERDHYDETDPYYEADHYDETDSYDETDIFEVFIEKTEIFIFEKKRLKAYIDCVSCIFRSAMKITDVHMVLLKCLDMDGMEKGKEYETEFNKITAEYAPYETEDEKKRRINNEHKDKERRDTIRKDKERRDKQRKDKQRRDKERRNAKRRDKLHTELSYV